MVQGLENLPLDRPSRVRILVFIFFISVFSLTLAEQGTMNTNKITNKQNIVVDITFFYIFGVRHSGREISVKRKGKDDSAIKKTTQILSVTINSY